MNNQGFLTEQNANMLFNMMKEYVYNRANYQISEPEWNFLIQVMKKYNHPKMSARDLNKQVLDHVIPVIMKKISDRLPRQQETMNMNARTLPMISQNQDVDTNYQKLMEARKPKDQTPNPVRFTDIEPEYEPIRTTPEDLIRSRNQDNEIEGCKVSSGRVRNLKFKKVK